MDIKDIKYGFGCYYWIKHTYSINNKEAVELNEILDISNDKVKCVGFRSVIVCNIPINKIIDMKKAINPFSEN